MGRVMEEGASMKSVSDRAVRSGKELIRNAKEKASYLTESHSKQSERNVYIREEE